MLLIRESCNTIVGNEQAIKIIIDFPKTSKKIIKHI